MSHRAIRIRPGTQRKLRDLASYFGEPISDVVERAIESLRRQMILEQTNLAFARLRSNRRDCIAERIRANERESTLADTTE